MHCWPQAAHDDTQIYTRSALHPRSSASMSILRIPWHLQGWQWLPDKPVICSENRLCSRRATHKPCWHHTLQQSTGCRGCSASLVLTTLPIPCQRKTSGADHRDISTVGAIRYGWSNLNVTKLMSEAAHVLHVKAVHLPYQCGS